MSSDKKTLKIKFDKKHTKKPHCSYQSNNQFIEYYLPNNYNYKVVGPNDNNYDIFIANVQTIHELDKSKINILVSVENMTKWTWYKHKEKYGDFGDSSINIYIYNHKSNLEQTYNYLCVPAIHTYINYFKNNYNTIQNKLDKAIDFNDRKFILIINRSKLNKEIDTVIDDIQKLFPNEKIDNIDLYSDQIKEVSCYHTKELLNVFSKYKFILCMENSYFDGYITEKIFNCFYANSIPLYKGAFNVSKFINKDSYIDLRNSLWKKKMINLSKDRNAFINMIKCNKLTKDYNDKNYKTLMFNVIKNKLKG